VDAYVDERRRQTHGLVGYIGAWHTHPGVAAEASELDEQALEQLVSGGAPSLLLIVGGPVEVWNTWLNGAGRPHVYARLTFPDENAATGDSARIGGDSGDS
jgi:integrative and conjugative element protein (TIGR02256 family)